MAFFKKSRRKSNAGLGDLIPAPTMELIEDVDTMEEKAHLMQRALKKYATSRKDELSKANKLAKLADQLAKNYGGNFGDDVDGLAALEKEFLKSVETTSLDPLKSYVKLFPKLSDATGSLIRAATAHKAATAKNKKSRGAEQCAKTKAMVEKTKSDLELQLSRLPGGLADVLAKTQAYFATAACAALQGQAIYANAVDEFIAGTTWSGAETTDADAAEPSSPQDCIAATEALLEQFGDISIVGMPRPPAKEGSFSS